MIGFLKRMVSRPGAALAHGAWVLILLGSAVRAGGSERGYVTLRVGETADFFHAFGGERKTLPFSVTLESFDVVRGPGPLAPVEQFESRVTVKGRGVKEEKGVIRVNHPLSSGPYRLLQFGYDPHDTRVSTFLVVRDPSVPFVYAGFFLLLIGTFLAYGRRL